MKSTAAPDLQPVLRGQLLHLRPLRSDDGYGRERLAFEIRNKDN